MEEGGSICIGANGSSDSRCFVSCVGLRSPVLFAAESTSMAKFSIELTLSTVTTFVPASSQACNEEEVTLCVNE